MIKKQALLIKRSLSAINNRDRSVNQKLATLIKHGVLILKKTKRLRIVFKSKPPSFSGWGMTSKHYLPWEEKKSTDLSGIKFARVNNLLKSKVEVGQFVLSQVKNEKSLVLIQIGSQVSLGAITSCIGQQCMRPDLPDSHN